MEFLLGYLIPHTLYVYCLFRVYRPTREFFIHIEMSPLPVKGCTFWPMLVTHCIGQWGFFSVQHLLWHGAFVYNGHLQGPVTLTPFAERLALELSLPVFTTYVCFDWDSNTQPSACFNYKSGITGCNSLYIHVII